MAENGTVKIAVGGEEFRAEKAVSPPEKFLGLRFRSEGRMLFSFSSDTRSRIDMFLVPESLHLYFLDSDRRVLEIQEAEPWTLNPKTWRFYRPASSYRYLLESFEPLGLEKGDKLEFEF